jgi:hypothetical protein
MELRIVLGERLLPREFVNTMGCSAQRSSSSVSVMSSGM